MIITAKFASVCPCCSARIAVGSKVEWNRGEKARHAACAGKAVVASTAIPRSAYASPRSGNNRGRWTGCSCGSRELPGGGLSANACTSCRFDEYDC